MFNNIQELFSGLLKDKKKLIIILVVIAIFIGLAYYVYTKHVSPKLNPDFVPNNELVQEGDSNEAELYLFYTEWCPHCKKAKPIWEKLKSEYEGKTINGVIVHFKEVDCDKDEKTADQFNVEGYPTIKLVKDSQVIEYDAKPDYETLVEFLNTSL
jgi:thiol-disulfide isomerase/thioredoxin